MFKENRTLTDKLREAIKPTPMKRRIQLASNRLTIQVSKLEKTVSQMEARDKTLHERCVKALASRDVQSATMFANECVEIRKLVKTSLSSQISLEQALLRLQTIEQFGDMVNSMGQVKGIIGLVRDDLEGKLPEISTGLADIEDSLSNFTTGIGQAVDADGPLIPASDESARVLKEADAMAEQKMKEKFPEIPAVINDPAKVR